MGGGTIFKAIGKKELEGILVIVPSARLVDWADCVLGENLALIQTLTFASRQLLEIRDLLLPKLVTGQIDVSHLELDAVLQATG